MWEKILFAHMHTVLGICPVALALLLVFGHYVMNLGWGCSMQVLDTFHFAVEKWDGFI